MPRPSMPKALKDKVLNEYNHRCAVCTADRPHIHHIDEDSTNNVIENLLPLCPNCHLTDQHNPARKVDIPKLRLFRQFKDPAILKPQFHPIYTRQMFLDTVEINYDTTGELERYAKELIEFISNFEMGDFYSKKLKELLKAEGMVIINFGDRSEYEIEQQHKNLCHTYRKRLNDNNLIAKELLVELLRYQNW